MNPNGPIAPTAPTVPSAIDVSGISHRPPGGRAGNVPRAGRRVRWGRRGSLLAAVALSTLVVSGCGSDVEGSVSVLDDPVCDAVATVAGVWGASAPATLLGNPEGLADFAAGLQGGFDRAVAVLAADAPPEVDDDLEVVTAALDAQYRDALAYAAGDMTAVPVLTPVERTALAGVEAWSAERCPGVGW